MKKILLSFLVIFLLAGCGNSQLRDLEGNEKSNYKIGETAIYDKVEYTVTDFRILEKEDEETQVKKIVGAVSYTVKNTTKKSIPWGAFGFLYENDEEIQGSDSSQDARDLLSSNTIEPNRTYKLTEEFDISKLDSSYRFLLVINDEKSIQMNVNLR